MATPLLKRGRFFIRTMQMDLESAKSGEVKTFTAPTVITPPKPAPQKIETPPSPPLKPALPPSLTPKSTPPPPPLPKPISEIKAPPPTLPIEEKISLPTPSSIPPPSSLKEKKEVSFKLPPILRIPGMPQSAPLPPATSKPVEPPPPRIEFKPIPQTHGREIPEAFKTQQEMPKHSSLSKTLFITLTIVVLGGGGFFAYTFFLASPPTPAIKPPPNLPITPPTNGGGETPITKPIQTGLIEVDGVEPINLQVGRKNDLLTLIGGPLNRERLVSEITRIEIKEGDRLISFQEFFETLEVNRPFGLIDNFNDLFELLVFTQSEGNRYLLLARLKEEIATNQTNLTRLQNQLASWDKTITQDFKPLLRSNAQDEPFNEGRFSYQNLTIRFFSSKTRDLGAFYTLWPEKQLWLFSSSRQGIIALIDRLR